VKTRSNQSEKEHQREKETVQILKNGERKIENSRKNNKRKKWRT
jgi:hypothetical protein